MTQQQEHENVVKRLDVLVGYFRVWEALSPD